MRPRRNSKLNRILLDANAGLPVREEALETFVRVSRDASGNPSSIHRAGRHAQAALENAREEVAGLLLCAARDIVFTSGATEANNLAILGLARAAERLSGMPIPLIASRAEHPAALAPLRVLQQQGFPLHLVNLDAHATADVDAMLGHASACVASLSVLQWANNETGVIQPIDALASHASDTHLWHCDAVQGIGKLDMNPSLWRATTLALSGHKFGAPKGIGVLRLSENAMLDPVQVGGGQQRSLRSGTESPALAASFAHALRLTMKEQSASAVHLKNMCKVFLAELKKLELPFRSNHCTEGGLPNTLNLSFPHLDGRMLIPACDADGLEVSAGAACSSGAALPSSVLVAAGLAPEAARASLRISLSPDLGESDAHEAAKRLGKLLRRMYEVAKR